MTVEFIKKSAKEHYEKVKRTQSENEFIEEEMEEILTRSDKIKRGIEELEQAQTCLKLKKSMVYAKLFDLEFDVKHYTKEQDKSHLMSLQFNQLQRLQKMYYQLH